MDVVTLSRGRLESFLTCQRQFQLRYREQVAWPDAPLPDEVATAVIHGHQFHQLIERHLLDLPTDTSDPVLKRWWAQFVQHPPKLPEGKRLVEASLTIPILDDQPTKRSYLLNGRFDLIIVGEQADGTPFAHIFDWKTSKPREAAELRRDWQTRLYLALVAEGGKALLPDRNQSIPPENIYFTYWFVHAPDAPQTIGYSASQHADNWRDLQAIAQQIDALPDDAIWPLTNDLTTCRFCPYQIICGRQGAGTTVPLIDSDAEVELVDEDLEPERP